MKFRKQVNCFLVSFNNHWKSTAGKEHQWLSPICPSPFPRNWQSPCCSCRCFPHLCWKHFTDKYFTTSISKLLQCLYSHSVRIFSLMPNPNLSCSSLNPLLPVPSYNTSLWKVLDHELKDKWWERFRCLKSICRQKRFFPLKMTSALLMLDLKLCQRGKIPYKNLEWFVLQHKCHHTGHNSNPCHQCPHSVGLKFLLPKLISLNCIMCP